MEVVQRQELLFRYKTVGFGFGSFVLAPASACRGRTGGYQYAKTSDNQPSNRLKWVGDTVLANVSTKDVDGQAASSYDYDGVGNLG